MRASMACDRNDRVFLVGAAGFEPATWSTQNSRATRLRYAPPLVREYGARYTVRPGPASWPGSPEPRMSDAIAGRDPVFFCRAAGDFQHGTNRPARRNDALRHRLGILGDPQNAAAGGDEQHIERD